MLELLVTKMLRENTKQTNATEGSKRRLMKSDDEAWLIAVIKQKSVDVVTLRFTYYLSIVALGSTFVFVCGLGNK